MAIEFKDSDVTISIPADLIKDKIQSADETEAKLLLALISDESFREDYKGKADEYAKIFACDKTDLDFALGYWRGAGVISLSAKKKKTTSTKSTYKPSYTPKEQAEVIDSNNLRPLLDECSNILGISLNSTDVNSIVTLYHHLGVDEGYIMLICEYCSSLGKKSLAYVSKMAYNLYDQGVDTSEKLEEYFLKSNQLADFYTRIRSIFGMGDRSLTAKEKLCFEKWTDWGFTEDVIKKAYDITIENTGKYTIGYLDKILSNWRESGYTTIEEIEGAQQKFNETNKSHSKSYETNEFFELALKKSNQNIIKIKQEKEKK